MPRILDAAGKVVILHECLYEKVTRPQSITYRGIEDGTMHRWLLRQRCKSWEYLDRKHPEMLADARYLIYPHLFGAARVCLKERDSAGFEQVRAFAQDRGLNDKTYPGIRVRLAALRMGALPFRLADQALALYQRLRSRKE